MSENIIQASWQALSDSIVYALLHTRGLRNRPDGRPEVRARPADRQGRAPTSRPTSCPTPGRADRPGELDGPQPEGTRLGFQGPDQGYALKLADERIRPRLQLSRGEHADDAISGCVGIAMRRASLYGRAPVIHDLTIAFTIWGYLDPSPPGRAGRAAPRGVRGRRPRRPPLRRGPRHRRRRARGDAADDRGGRAGRRYPAALARRSSAR